jgi:hypothetical protein
MSIFFDRNATKNYNTNIISCASAFNGLANPTLYPYCIHLFCRNGRCEHIYCDSTQCKIKKLVEDRRDKQIIIDISNVINDLHDGIECFPSGESLEKLVQKMLIKEKNNQYAKATKKLKSTSHIIDDIKDDVIKIAKQFNHFRKHKH